MADDMNRVEPGMTLQGARYLRHRGCGRVEPDRDYLGPQTPDQRLDVADGWIDKGNFFDFSHGINFKMSLLTKTCRSRHRRSRIIGRDM
jgi:hypothetical protein